MITPSINWARLENCPPIWETLSLEDVQKMLQVDVQELAHLYQIQAEDAAEAQAAGRQPNYRIRILIRAWERTQDAHWSWYKEISNHVRNSATRGPSRLGAAAVGQGN
ncbi:hypothetical protein SEA_DIMINIMUS_13 [Mycobacterium phage Diminimus]|uniref:Uncharacterized protein n=5 Tax=Bongovirus bongo TaxID=1983750 RepID=A0A0M4RBW1_9CAUD|nr:hypothetical protein PEGLEG_12 [Mycobacterium phage PegLeg]YP_009604870.1 hypothetical protein FDH95_gp012 [Mycobacterium phage Bongo]ALF00540.1 hypothetical protein SEA_BRICOLE_12 [Mycobacterium phage Bricole]AXQ52653.1 hypothetical protein SEA_IPHANE7_12 [Mycobacterium phage IPhane7]QGJ93159.1 hypothetical protein SEA_TYDAWG_12 [Mycobacterium phage TyDawg]WNM75226.1 hypothetical protein SEA_AUSPICE_12 [Mycobacterium phage Auspice]WNN95715.1 hypothetical protein SEA_GLASKE16_13 [Mycobacte